MKYLAIFALAACLAGCIVPLSGASTPTGAPTPLQSARATMTTISGAAPVLIQVGDDSQVRLLDLASGRYVLTKPALELPAGEKLSASLLSPDGSSLALVSGAGQVCRRYGGGSACYLAGDTLHLVDVEAWQMLDIPLEGHGYVSQLAFSSDGTRLALVFNSNERCRLLLYDVSGGRLLALRSLAYQPDWLGYALGGKALAVYGVAPGSDPGVVQPASPRLQLLDPDTLQPQWGLRLGGILGLEGLLSGEWCLENCAASHEQRSLVFWKPGTTLSPDGRRMYIIHADRDKLSIIDLEKGDIQNAAILSRTAWLERLLESTSQPVHATGMVEGAMKIAITSPNGERLYVLTRELSPGDNSGGEKQSLQVIDLSLDASGKTSGRILAEFDLDPRQNLFGLAHAQGGSLYLSGYSGGDPLFQRIDTATLQPSAALKGWQVSAASRPDVLLGARPSGAGSELALIDPVTLEVLRSWKVEGEAAWLPGD